MTKEPTKAELLKTIKRQDAAVRKLTKALNFTNDKLEATQAVAAAYLKQLQERPTYGEIYSGVTTTADQPSLPWDMPNPFESVK